MKKYDVCMRRLNRLVKKYLDGYYDNVRLKHVTQVSFFENCIHPSCNSLPQAHREKEKELCEHIGFNLNRHFSCKIIKSTCV